MVLSSETGRQQLLRNENGLVPLTSVLRKSDEKSRSVQRAAKCEIDLYTLAPKVANLGDSAYDSCLLQRSTS